MVVILIILVNEALVSRWSGRCLGQTERMKRRIFFVTNLVHQLPQFCFCDPSVEWLSTSSITTNTTIVVTTKSIAIGIILQVAQMVLRLSLAIVKLSAALPNTPLVFLLNLLFESFDSIPPALGLLPTEQKDSLHLFYSPVCPGQRRLAIGCPMRRPLC